MRAFSARPCFSHSRSHALVRSAVVVLLSVLVLGALFGGSPTHHAARTENQTYRGESAPMADLVNDRMVAGWVMLWQRRLGLEEWKIDAKIVRTWDLPRGAVANVHWSLPRKTATIKVLNPIDSTLKASEITRDTELSVVHELVHLSMAKLPLDPNHTELEEETVKRISVALLRLQEQTSLAQQIITESER